MSNTKKVTISLTPEQQEKARFLSKDLFGKENISGLVGFLIELWLSEQLKLGTMELKLMMNEILSRRLLAKIAGN